ncbi:MAG: 23S rRNA (adenine(2503)-C(2))-methyltransferase RlmN [Mariprofundaceae bacterium]
MDRMQLRTLCKSISVKPSHAERLIAGIFRHGITDMDAIPELPASFRAYLRAHAHILQPEILSRQQADDGTRKMLLGMPDGGEVETVLIPGEGRLTQCISTQVGCAIACKFCLTATAGLARNLTTEEMVAEVMTAQSQCDRKIRNLVLMGMGEPLHNYDAVAQFIRIASDPLGMAFSPNRITLSTAGLVPGIERMIADNLPCNLAVSLNATTDEVRSRIMPINRKYPIADLLQALRNYIAARGRKRVLIEYVLLDGINDSIADAKRLVALLKDINSTINLLPFNPFPGSRYQRPASATVSAFRDVLVKADLVAVVRESRGREISAACGQLKTEAARRHVSSRHTA